MVNMLSENYELIEAIALNLSLFGLFVLMGLAVRDLLNKNKVSKLGRFVIYTVLLLGTVSFIAKGVIQLFW